MARTERKLSVSESLSAHDVQADVVEWWCAAVLRESSPDLFEQRAQGLETALSTLDGHIPCYGRLYSRVLLAAFFVDISRRPIDTEEEDDDDENDALSKLEPETWAMLRQQLHDIKSSLLRKDANASEKDPEDATVDEKLVALAKFSADYDAVESLLSLHEIVARFRQVLEGLAPTKNQKALLKQVEKAVDDFKALVMKLDMENLDELTSFLLKDIYKTEAKDLPQRLCEHLHDIMCNDENEFSYTLVRTKVLRLLQRWHACVLSVPTLCRLGYGGMSAKNMSVPEASRRNSLLDENASVSSWGVDEEEYEERKQVEAMPDAVSRKTSTDEDTDGYATADEGDVTSAFAFATQPPVEENLPSVPEEEEESEYEDKKRKAKHSPAKGSAKSLPRRSSRLAGERSVTAPLRRSSRVAKLPDQRTTRVAAALAQNQETTDAQVDDDVGSVELEASPTKEHRRSARPLNAAKKPDNNEINKEQETSPPKRARKPVAEPGTSVIGWSSESEDEPSPKRRHKTRKLQKRRRFTEEEMEAIRSGVRRFGEGKWTYIRINSGGVLLSRTNVNIKDCYRNMVKRGEGV